MSAHGNAKLNPNLVIARYRAGGTLRSLASEFGVTHEGIRQCLLAHGQSLRPHGWHSRLDPEIAALAAEIAADIPKQFPAGASVSDLVDWLGSSPTRIKQAIDVLLARGTIKSVSAGVWA